MDYKQLGLRVGLEIHQQLASGSKLFCRCPIVKSETFPHEINRKLIPVHSEMGEEDPAALFEYLRDRTFVYKYNTESSCLLELDEMPPRAVNKNALITSLQISRLLNCNILDEVYFMRKMVIDGSAVSSFQRTGLISTNGYIDTSFGRVGIQTIGLEEDSAPAIARDKVIEYRLDRLGTPLVEIATDASIHSPEHAKETAEKIGSLLRSLEVVRGIGSIRQDVNISISGGARVEIKGFQELDKIPELVENEVKRQICLLEVKEELHRRGYHELHGHHASDVTDLFKHTKCNFVRKAIEDGKHVYGLKVPKFSGLLAKQCGDRTLGKELSTYPASHGFGIIHSDEDLAKYNLVNDFTSLRKELGAETEDLVLIVVGNNVEKAVYSLIKRLDYCLAGVPEETRVADGIGSRYARPLPGSGRLYPESDVPAILITSALKNVMLPKTLDERKAELSLPKEMAEQIVKSPYYSSFVELKKHDEILAANLFLSNFPDLRRKGFDIDKLLREKPGDFDYLLEKVSKGEVPQNAITSILIEVISGVSIETATSKYSGITDSLLEDLVREIMKHSHDKSDSAIIGMVLAKAHGRADGKKVAELVKKYR